MVSMLASENADINVNHILAEGLRLHKHETPIHTNYKNKVFVWSFLFSIFCLIVILFFFFIYISLSLSFQALSWQMYLGATFARQANCEESWIAMFSVWVTHRSVAASSAPTPPTPLWTFYPSYVNKTTGPVVSISSQLMPKMSMFVFKM